MRFKWKYRTYSFLMVILFLFSCRKDKVPQIISENTNAETCDCVPLSSSNVGVFDQYVQGEKYYLWPQFNPNNDDEIIYVEPSPGNIKLLYKLNLITLEKTLIFQGVMSYEPSWGFDDWILLNLMDYQIWKIKSDGTQLTQVTSNGAWFHPEWSSTEDKFIAYQGYINNNLYPGKIWDINGTIIDSFEWSPTVGSWRHPLYYGGVSTGKVIVIDPFSNQFISTLNTDPNKSYNSFNWISGSEALLTNIDGMYRYNIYTKDITKLKCSCSSRRYIGGTTNSSNTKIIYQLAVLTRIDGGTVKEERELVIMNFDGTDEEIIAVP